MPPSFVAYIDEAGDEGLLSPSPCCPKWFVLSAVVMPRVNEHPLIEMLREFRFSIGMEPKKPVHFRRLEHPDERRNLIQRMVALHSLFRVMSVLVYKPCLLHPEAFRDGRLYFYHTRYLLERVSWLCKATRTYREAGAGDGSVEVVFSKRKDLSYSAFCDYMRYLRNHEHTQIDWGIVKPEQIRADSPGRRAGLQIADAAASGVNCAVYGGTNCTEEWVEALKPVFYRRRGKYRGYGLKFCPSGIENEIAHGLLAPWANRVYPD